jgi:hypothetical protein
MARTLSPCSLSLTIVKCLLDDFDPAARDYKSLTRAIGVLSRGAHGGDPVRICGLTRSKVDGSLGAHTLSMSRPVF